MKYFVIGEDKRSKELRKMFEVQNSIALKYYEADVIVTTIPFTRDGTNITGTEFKIEELITFLSERKKILITGSIPLNIRDILREKGVEYYDVMQSDKLAIKNAIPTAEGAILEAIENSDRTLYSSNILILGYGKIGKALAKRLEGFGANIYIEARKSSDIAYINCQNYQAVKLEELGKYLPKFDYIFNTVPHILLNKERLDILKKDALIVDLASVPGGVDFTAAKELGLNVVWALSLPSKCAPKSAARYLKEEIESIFE